MAIRLVLQLNLADATAEAGVGKIPLGRAIETLTVAMQRLPELAQKLDANQGMGFFSGDPGDGVEALHIHFDLHEDDALKLEEGALPLAEIVGPMTLDPITVMDDDRLAWLPTASSRRASRGPGQRPISSSTFKAARDSRIARSGRGPSAA
jgi:hypothetical protein